MISEVILRNFKQFREQKFDLSDQIILAGPNNCGKTTLLQAISAWNLALQRWLAGRSSKSTAKQRTGVAITRRDFTAVPLRDMSLLWTDTSVSLKKADAPLGKPGHPRPMEVTLKGLKGDQTWDLTFEFRHQSSEMLYVKPSSKHLDPIPEAAKELNIVHVPPFSGIGPEETRLDMPYQNLLIGQGKAGDILRNLLLEIYQNEDKSGWDELRRSVQEIFHYTLLPPKYDGPHILCDYLKGIPTGRGRGGLVPLDLVSAGSGFLQVLLLLCFFYARPSSVLLLDEPDAHLHVILQKQIYDRLRSLAAKRNCQLITATHSEVLIDGTDPANILSFYQKPHRLAGESQRDQIREALRKVSSMEMLLTEQSPGVLYLEGETDFSLLRTWAVVLDHPIKKWFLEQPFWHSNKGRDPGEAKGHFFALRAINPELKGFLLLDGDNRGLRDHDVLADGLIVERWVRYEIESYLIHPSMLNRYLDSTVGSLFALPAMNYLDDELPSVIYRNPLKKHAFLNSTPVSKTLLPEFFKKAGKSLEKSDYFLIAEQMKIDEIPEEVKEKLDAIQKALGL